MWLLVGTMIFYAAVEAVLAGLSLAALAHKFGKTPKFSTSFLILVPVFAFLALYYIPAIDALDATLTIRNEAIAKEIGPGTPIVLRELFRFGISDPVVWCMQATLGAAVSHWASR